MKPLWKQQVEGERFMGEDRAGRNDGLRKPADWLSVLIEKDRLSHTSRLVRGLIHNINGPLHNLSMLVEMLMFGQEQVDKLFDDADLASADQYRVLRGKQRDRLQRVMQQISSLSEMLQDFGTVQELMLGESDVDICFVLDKLAKTFRADLFFKHRVNVTLHLEENLPPVHIPGRYLIPSLMHLIRNALLALGDASEKKLDIACSREGQLIRVAIRDSGIGFDLQKAEDLQEAFCSGWPREVLENDEIEKHFGLGLFIIRTLLHPYGVRCSLTREENETLAMLEIPLQEQS